MGDESGRFSARSLTRMATRLRFVASAVGLSLIAGAGYYYVHTTARSGETVERHLRLLQSAANALDAQRRWAETEAWKRRSAIDPPTNRSDLSIELRNNANWSDHPPVMRWRFAHDWPAAPWWLEGESDSATLKLRPQQYLEWVLRSARADGNFDTVFLAAPDGRILAEAGRGLHAKLDVLVPSWWQVRGGNKLADTTIGDVPYVLFLHPVYGEIELTLGGLMTRRAKTYAALAIPLSIAALAVAALLLIFINWPFLKILLMGDWQRVRRLDAALVAVSAVLTLSFLTIFGFGLSAYWKAGQDVDDQLVALSTEVSKNVAGEITAAAHQLRALATSGLARPELREAVSRAAGSCDDIELETLRRERIDSLRVLLKDVDELYSGWPFGEPEYPFFESFSLIDCSGMQVAKWSPTTKPPPRIYLGDREYVRLFQAPASPRSYVLESISSQTTGRRQAVVSISTGALSGALEEVPVAAIVLNMRSLIDPVMVSGFGFAIIDEEGLVLFHSSSRKNLVENLLDEAGSEPRLQSAMFARRTAHFNMRYGGGDYRAYVAPLRESSWTLVTFHDKENKRTALVELMTTSVLLAVISVAVLLVGLSALLLAAPRRSRTAWLWPDPGRTAAYRDIAVAHAAFIAAIVLTITLSDDIDRLVPALMVPPLALLTMFLRLSQAPRDDVDHAGHVRLRAVRFCAAGAAAVIIVGLVLGVLHLRQTEWAWTWAVPALAAAGVLIGVRNAIPGLAVPPHTTSGAAGANDRRPMTRAYLCTALLTLVLASALPALACFMVACGVHMDLFVRHAQLMLAREAEAYRSRPAPTTANVTLQQLHTYHEFFFRTSLRTVACEAGGSGTTERHVLHDWVHEWVHTLPYYSPRSIEMRELIHDAAADGTWKWVTGHDGAAQLRWPLVDQDGRASSLVVTSERPQLLGTVVRAADGHGHGAVPDGPARGSAEHGPILWGFSALPYLTGVLVLSLAWIITRFIANRVFLLGLADPLWVPAADRIKPPIYGNLLIICRRPEDANEIVDGSFEEVDLKALRPDAPGAWKPAGAPVLVRNFDRCWRDRRRRDASLSALEYLTRVRQQRVVITAGPDLFQTPGTSSAATRAADEQARLRLFNSVIVIDADRFLGARAHAPRAAQPAGYALAGSSDQTIEQIPAASGGVPGIQTRVELDPGLAGNLVVGPLLADQHADPVLLKVVEGREPDPRDIPGGDALNREQLLEEIGEGAQSYYEWVWAGCTHRERKLLVHVAEEGLVNEKDHRTVRRLLVRGLIRRDPEVRPMTESFRRYLVWKAREPLGSAIPPDPRSAWDTIRLPLLGTLAAGTLFLFATQQELLSQATALASTAAIAVPAILKLVGSLIEPRGTSASPA